MASKTRGYSHSAYWYAYHYGYSYSEQKSYAGQYIDEYTNYYSRRKGRDLYISPYFSVTLLGMYIMMDMGVAMKYEIEKFTDPEKRAAMIEEIRHDLRILRRPFYYSRETKRRRLLAQERRKVRRRRTTAPMPTAEDIRAAWSERKNSKEAMIRLGGMMHDLECYVDNYLKIEGGKVVGRNHGIRGWIFENVPELGEKYKTLMRYKAMANSSAKGIDRKLIDTAFILMNDLRTYGYFFEGLAMRDLRVYMDALDGDVRHYHDKAGLECDAVLHTWNGEYALVEIKLGGEALINEGVEVLNKMGGLITAKKLAAPAFKMVLTATGEYAYRREEDGVIVCPLSCLKT